MPHQVGALHDSKRPPSQVFLTRHGALASRPWVSEMTDRQADRQTDLDTRDDAMVNVMGSPYPVNNSCLLFYPVWCILRCKWCPLR
jgi:hypothetical protein